MSGGSTIEKALAKQLAISVSGIQKACKIRERGVPELEQAIMGGRATIGSAYWLAMNATPQAQRDALTAAPTKAALSHLVAQIKKHQGFINPHECICRTCGRGMPA